MQKLIINNTEKFDQEVWNTKTNFTQKEYNVWLKDAVKALGDIYEQMDDGENAFNTNILGDVINLLNNIEIKVIQ